MCSLTIVYLLYFFFTLFPPPCPFPTMMNPNQSLPQRGPRRCMPLQGDSCRIATDRDTGTKTNLFVGFHETISFIEKIGLLEVIYRKQNNGIVKNFKNCIFRNDFCFLYVTALRSCLTFSVIYF